MLTIQDGMMVNIHYTLNDDEGELLDESAPNDPLQYLHGDGQIVVGLEKALEGCKEGDKISVAIPPVEGYGEQLADLRLKVPRSEFPDDVEFEEGMQFAADLGDDNFHMFWVVGVDEEALEIDGNHPLAGMTLHFDVEVGEIREATEEELNGEEYHQCGCGHDHCH